MQSDIHDIATVGGGLGGATLAKVMDERGAWVSDLRLRMPATAIIETNGLNNYVELNSIAVVRRRAEGNKWR